MSSWQGAIRSRLDSKSNDGRPCRQDASGGDEQWQGTEMRNDGKHAGNHREPSKLNRQCQRERLASCKHPDVPSQRQKVERTGQCPDAEPCTGAEDRQNQAVFGELEICHCLCIQRQADQNPTTTPTSNNGALQKMPVPSLGSSHRPMNRPIKVGVTMIQPRTPI